MPSANNLSLDNETQQQITVMALRERIMEFFKGDCVKRLTDNNNIRVVRTRDHEPRGQFQYQRRVAESKNATMVFIGEAPLFTMELLPDTLTFHVGVATRSKELRFIYNELTIFMGRYLAGVDIKLNKGSVPYA